MASSAATDPSSTSSATATTTTAAAGATTAPQGKSEPSGTETYREKGRTGEASRSISSATPLEAITISCLTNAHYHSSREAYLDTVHRWFMFFVIVLGAAALTDAMPKIFYISFGVAIDPSLFKEIFAATAAILAGLDLTFDLSNRARSHAMMKRRYFELLARVREEKITIEEGSACLDEFSADEEPPYRVLYLSCWNAAQVTVFGDGMIHLTKEEN